jgi:hypothetical protein
MWVVDSNAIPIWVCCDYYTEIIRTKPVQPHLQRFWEALSLKNKMKALKRFWAAPKILLIESNQPESQCAPLEPISTIILPGCTIGMQKLGMRTDMKIETRAELCHQAS